MGADKDRFPPRRVRLGKVGKRVRGEVLRNPSVRRAAGIADITAEQIARLIEEHGPVGIAHNVVGGQSDVDLRGGLVKIAGRVLSRVGNPQ